MMFRFLLILAIVVTTSLHADDAVVMQSVRGKTVFPLESTNDSPVVLIFIAVDCPVANSYVPEINRIAEEYRSKKVNVTLVHSEVALSNEEALAHQEDYQIQPEVVIDKDHTLVKRAGAKVTPEAVVFDHGGKVVYRGRIDDLYTDYGDRRQKATTHELREVLDALLAGKPVTVEEKSSIGCLIEPLQ